MYRLRINQYLMSTVNIYYATFVFILKKNPLVSASNTFIFCLDLEDLLFLGLIVW